MTADLSSLPELPDPEAIDHDAKAIGDSGDRAAKAAGNAKTAWTPLHVLYDAPEGSHVWEAMGPVETYGNETQNVTALAKAALNDYATAVRALKPKFDSLKLAASICYPDSTDEDPNFGANKDKDLERQAGLLAHELTVAQQTCAQKIKRADPGQVPNKLPGLGPVASPQGGKVRGIVKAGLKRIDTQRVRLTVGVTLSDGKIDLAGIKVAFADGSFRSLTRIPLKTPDALLIGSRDVNTFKLTTGKALNPPAWAARSAKYLGWAGNALTIYGAGSGQWNEDQQLHPDWGTTHRVESAAETTVVKGGLTIAGAYGGAAIGQALIPIPVVGGLIGGWVGGAVGSGAGTFLMDLRHGKSIGSAAKDAGKAAWHSLFG